MIQAATAAAAASTMPRNARTWLSRQRASVRPRVSWISLRNGSAPSHMKITASALHAGVPQVVVPHIGDQDFFVFLKAYASDPNVTYGVATTDDVRRVAEQVSGRDLSTFFHQWIELPWYPTFEVEWTDVVDGGTSAVQLTLRQVQTHHVYELPLQVRVVDTGSSTLHTIEIDEAVETRTFVTSGAVLDVQIDPDSWTLFAIEDQIESPSFTDGILLVNGVDWATYATTIGPAYADSAFTGRQPFEFWDVMPTPPASYPSQLPPPQGTGPIPSEVLGRYSTVVWVGNDYLGDLQPWLDAAILDYLEQGGNLLLLARRGQAFLTHPRLAYLGTDFASETYQSVGNALADLPGLVPMGRTGTQNLVSPLALDSAEPETVNLFVDSFDPNRSLGVYRRPAEGGSARPAGGHFAHIAGRPYRWDTIALRQNTEFILNDLFGEPTATSSPTPTRRTTRIEGAQPNPFNPRVTIDYTVDRERRVALEVFDLRGRRVRMLLDEVRPAGDGSTTWNGLDDTGAPVASGVYTVRLRAGDPGDPVTDHVKVTLVR